MSYTWDIKSIKRKLLIAKLIRHKYAIESYENMINGFNIASDNFDKNMILIQDRLETINYQEVLKCFIAGLSYIPEDLYSDLTELFYFFEDFSSLKDQIKLPHIDIKDDDLVTLTHDIIASLNNKTFLHIFEELIKKDNHLLNIQSDTENTKGIIESVGGITYKDPLNKKSYINIFRNHTLEDVEIMVHESMHYILNYLMYKRYKKEDIRILFELEGEFGSIYTTRYLEKLGYQEESRSMRSNQLNTLLASSYLISVSHALFQTSKNEIFYPDEAAKIINEHLENHEVKILESELPYYLVTQGYFKMATMISYLIALELISDYDIKDIPQKIYDLKYHDSSNLLENLDKNGIHFHKDDYQQLIKEYKTIHKIN